MEPKENRGLFQPLVRVGEKQVTNRIGVFYPLHLLIVVTRFCCTFGLNSEGLALLAFKQAVDDPGKITGNWNPNDTTPCKWSGVKCDLLTNQTVEELQLPREKLRGPISEALSDLKKLQVLNLHDNALFGPLPPGLFKSASLRKMYLFNNNLSGSLPSNVDQLLALQVLDVSNNGFVGGIPTKITGCTQLRILVLKANQFSGSIPGILGNALKSLKQLDLSSNQFYGTIPPSLGNLNLQNSALNLSHNLLTGSIPENLGNLRATVKLDFSYNNLSGPIPRNGIFANQGPSAFLNNVELCGDPLPTQCSSSPSSSPAPSLTPAVPAGRGIRKTGLSPKALIAIVVGDSVGIIAIVMVFVYCLRRRSNCQNLKKHSDNGITSSDNSASNSQSWSLGCFPVSKDGSEASEKIGPGELTRLDHDVKFDLEELLRASAYVLGKSGVGIVYKALLEEGVAVAVRRLGEGGANSYKEFESEAQLIGKIRHPNIVSLRAYYWAVDEKLLIYDYIPNGSLAAALHARSPEAPVSTPLSWVERLKIAQGAARGLAYIHACGGKRKLVHKDIKPSNILLDVNMDAKISDLGLARLQNLAGGGVNATKPAEDGTTTGTVPSNHERAGGLTGSVARRAPPLGIQLISQSSSYYPPESVEVKKKPTQKWDVYSFGMVLLELLSGRSPSMHLASSEVDLATWIRETVEERKPITEILDTHLSAEVSRLEREFMEALQIGLLCTDPSPEQRPVMSAVSHSLQQIGRKLEICMSD